MIGGFIFTETSPAAPGTAISSQTVPGSSRAGVATPLDDWEGLDLVCEIGNPTGGTLDVYIQSRPDPSENWFDLVHFAQSAAAGGAKTYRAPLSLATVTTAPIAVGKNLSPALATGANSVVNGAWTDSLRVLMVAGSGTSASTTVKVTVAPQRARTNQM